MVATDISATQFDVEVISSLLIAGEGIYPAIDLNRSKSTALSQSIISDKHRKVAHTASAAICNATESLYLGALADPKWAYNQDADKRTSVQALRFLSQGLFVAEPFTGKKASFVSTDNLISQFDAILAGRHQATSPTAFFYTDELPAH